MIPPVFIESPDPFWLVWSDQGGVPTVRHRTEDEAHAEACRLAEKHRHRRFYILRCISHVEQVVIQTATVETKYKSETSPGGKQ